MSIEDKPLDLDELLKDADLDESEEDEENRADNIDPQVSNEPEEIKEPVVAHKSRARKYSKPELQYQSFIDDVKIVKEPEGLEDSGHHSGSERALRFPFEDMEIGDAFPINGDPKGIMRRSLMADIEKMKKRMPSYKRRVFKVRRDLYHQYYCVRIADRVLPEDLDKSS